MFFSEMLTLLAPCNFPLTFVSLQLQSSKIKTVPACALSFWSLDCWPLNKGADCMYLHSSLYQTEKGSHFCVIWGTEVYALFVFIYLVPHAGTFWWTHISCCRWTHSQEQKKMCSSKSWCLHIKLIKNLQDIVEAVEWIKDASSFSTFCASHFYPLCSIAPLCLLISLPSSFRNSHFFLSSSLLTELQNPGHPN